MYKIVLAYIGLFVVLMLWIGGWDYIDKHPEASVGKYFVVSGVRRELPSVEFPAFDIEYLTETMYAQTNTDVLAYADASAEVIDTLEFTEEVEVLGVSENWAHVRFEQTEGYVPYSDLVSDNDFIRVHSTAYCNDWNGRAASGRDLVNGYSVAGQVAWLNKYVYVYTLDGKCMGLWRFDDTGYGLETGVGESKMLPDMSIGTIENGTAIDLYYESKDECKQWGRRDVYIRIVDEA